MLPILTDENFDGRILHGLRRRMAALDAVRVLFTHDEATMPRYAYERVGRHEALSGVVVVPDEMSVGRAIEDLLLLLELSAPEDVVDQVMYLPL